ncbi:MAG TPA: DUF1080 domain-containing protein [Chthoniobacterales bacterium]|jgi:hypothetical protein
MRRISIVSLLVSLIACAMAADPPPEATEVWSPVPGKVSPGKTDGAPPSDAVILFDGRDLSAWETERGGAAKWIVEDNAFVVRPGTGAIQTREHFSDCQLHLEWMVPDGAPSAQKGQARGNSGVFLQGRYEVQILDSYDNPTYANGQAGAIYKQFSPLVNACKPAGQWQSYDIIFTAPRFAADGSLISPAKVTVLQNGVLIQNDAILRGPTTFRGEPAYRMHGPGPVTLQDHGNPVRFRNVWLRRL